jgi:hypothetical protein
VFRPDLAITPDALDPTRVKRRVTHNGVASTPADMNGCSVSRVPSQLALCRSEHPAHDAAVVVDVGGERAGGRAGWFELGEAAVIE